MVGVVGSSPIAPTNAEGRSPKGLRPLSFPTAVDHLLAAHRLAGCLVHDNAPMVDLPALLEALVPAMRRAGAAVMDVYASDFEVRGKSDASPVTEADERAEALLTASIDDLGLGWPVVAEECASRGAVLEAGPWFWLVDPLDGTKEFVARNGEFTVNVGLVHDGVPVMGLVLVPVLDRLYLGAMGHGAWKEEGEGRREPIQCRPDPAQGLTVLDSRSHRDGHVMDDFLANLPVHEVRRVGSSLKLGLIAEGQADLYARFGPTMEWDLAAGDAVLRAAGGGVCDMHGRPLRYGKQGFVNPAFVARGLGRVAPG